MNILTLFACFDSLLPNVSVRRLAIICRAILTMTGRITMLSISRWSEKSGSYRSMQRFSATRLPWAEMFVKFFETHHFNAADEYILAGDETVIGKAGNETFGVERFYSGLKGKVIKGLSFFVLSAVNTRERKSYPLRVKQTVKSEAEKEVLTARKKRKSKKSKKAKANLGRRHGSRNRDKKELKLSPELLRINGMLVKLLKLTGVFVKIKYLALDGWFGHSQTVLMSRANDLHLISKLRKDAVLLEKYEGKYRGRGAKKKYGARLRYDLLPPKYLVKSEREKDVITNYYEGIFLHKEFADELKVVIIVKLNVKTQKTGHAILFSSDVELGWEKLTDYYGLRFQIEFNFRDAKQHFGLEDFMNRTETGVENASNLSFLMVNVSTKLLKNEVGKSVGINDLKTHYRGAKYAVLVLKKVLPNAEPILINGLIEEVGRLGSIYRTKSATSTA